MKYILFRILSFFLCITGLLLTQSCKDELKEHYDNEAIKAVNISMLDYIKSEPSFSMFDTMISISGYDSLLNAMHSYTVWIPDNSALQGIDMDSLQLVKDIVSCHIARFLHTTSSASVDTVVMVNGKRFSFLHNQSGQKIGSAVITKSGVLTTNGIVYGLSSHLSFVPNIFEYIQRTEGLDSVLKYMNSLTKKKFSLELSTYLYTNGDGEAVYDSFYVDNYNKLFSGDKDFLFARIGNIDHEDSAYSVILPHNDGWNEAYKRIKEYYVSDHKTDSAAIKRMYTQYTLVRDLVFRGRFSDPNALSLLTSTTGSKYYTPGALFTNASGPEILSNGNVFITKQLQNKDTSSWFKEIRVEAENCAKTLYNAKIYTKESYGSPLHVSNKSFLEINPSASQAASSVEFGIPGTLSATYNIYVVFVPTAIVDTANKKPCRVRFTMAFYDRNNTSAIPKIKKSESKKGYYFTNVTDTTKILVYPNYKIPWCDMDLKSQSKTNLSVRVYNEVTTTLLEKTYNPVMRVDCIIFEPVAK